MKDKALIKKEKKEGKVGKAFVKFVDVLSKKWLVDLSSTLLLIAIIFAIYVGVTYLLEKVTLPQLDCTSEKIYSLSEETKTKVGAMYKDISITLINYKDNNTVTDLINKYKELNKKIKVDEINDLAGRTDLMIKYSLNATDSLIIISSGDKETTLTDTDLYTYDYSTYKQIDTTEEAITNALVDVTSDIKHKVYFISNHMAYPQTAFTTIIEKIKADANEVEQVDLLTEGEVPDDCDVLVITTLKEDLLETERDMIVDYINNGGKLLLMCGANTSNITLTNFNKVLDLYGIKFENGVVFEGKEEKMLSGYPDIIIEDMQANSITKNGNMNIKAAFIDAAPITMIDDSEKQEELGVKYEKLLTTSDSAFIRTNLMITSEKHTSSDSEEGSYTVGVLATKTLDDDKTSKLILYSDEIFAMDMPIQLGNYQQATVYLYNNKDIVANAISYLNEREDTITIRKNTENVTYNVSKAQHNVIMAIIFITPAVIIAVGILVWIIRKKSR